jgi:tRNA (guanine37-N1)-methyltransferase
MTVHVITLFPELIDAYVSSGILARARSQGKLLVISRQLRDFATDKHHTVDDYPYGGGAGIILKPDVMARAIDDVIGGVAKSRRKTAPVVFTTPHGRPFNSTVAREYSGKKEWIVVCGHYGGFDRRVIDEYATDEVSVGDYVLMGGELAAMVMIEAAARFIPDVLGNQQSADLDTFEDTLLGPPVYTRPAQFNGTGVPPVLLSGNHLQIAKWRRQQQLETTMRRRPDLLQKARLTEEDVYFLESVAYKQNNEKNTQAVEETRKLGSIRKAKR